MSRYSKIEQNRFGNEEEVPRWGMIARDGGLVAMALILAIMGGCPMYNVWEQGLVGKAALKRAEQDRQIAIQEAQATLESATLLAGAEVERAKGVAEANQIIADGLGGSEGYLRYLYIQSISEHAGEGGQIIYIPTEAALPILEATRK